jgi:hypothetical protein
MPNTLPFASYAMADTGNTRDTKAPIRGFIKRTLSKVKWWELRHWSDDIPFMDQWRYSKLGQKGRHLIAVTQLGISIPQA